MDEDESSATIVSAIIAMIHALGLTLVAEGVERPSHAALLRAQGCDAAQAFSSGTPSARRDRRALRPFRAGRRRRLTAARPQRDRETAAAHGWPDDRLHPIFDLCQHRNRQNRNRPAARSGSRRRRSSPHSRS
ncbi:EAL domain-containing protein [Pengzhenrongella phosphoraccumulans]|uniref:EAL domain-containing protein n=1 Tax=Pengzhenrongella phosphoraccumulans TaxID=3114394 RepID=UPI00388D53C9